MACRRMGEKAMQPKLHVGRARLPNVGIGVAKRQVVLARHHCYTVKRAEPWSIVGRGSARFFGLVHEFGRVCANCFG